jgi:chemotaxis protein histidine kinase CheA
LPVTRALVDLLEGSIEVLSAPGEGARFTCRLPRRMPLEDASTAAFEGNMFIFDNPEER